MGQRRNAKSVRNFVIFLLILQNCGQARTQPEIEPEPEPKPVPVPEPQPKSERELQQRRDGLAKFEFNRAQPVKDTAVSHNESIGPADPLHVFNFAKMYKTLYAQLLQASEGAQRRGRGLHRPQAQLLWQTPAEGGRVATTSKPLHVLQQLELDLAEQLKYTTTSKPFSVLEHLSLDQASHLRRQTPNISFNIAEALQMEQDRQERHTTTVAPIDVFEQLEDELQEHESSFEVLQPETAEPLEQHKSESESETETVPEEATRAKGSNKRKRKRIQRRRKRIRRRRKRKRKKKRKKKKKKKRKKGDKNKKRKKKKKKPTHDEYQHIVGQQAQLIYANPTKQPYHSHHSYYPKPQKPVGPTTILQLVTTKRPVTTKAPFSKIKYLLRHNGLFKKKKKEWFNHVGHVLYPFIKFIAFFTILNPFTLGVFLFTLISPVVFGFLGFVALSVLVKPFLHLVFGVKRNVDDIDRRRYLANKRAEQLKLNLRPVTIHKHYYQQKPLHSTPPRHHPPLVDWRRQATQPAQRRHNPLLPADRAALRYI